MKTMRERLGVFLVRLLARAEHRIPGPVRAQCWAWLGCYRIALRALPMRTRRPGSVAIRSLAASGRTADAERMARSLRSPRPRRSAAAAVAAFHPRLAAELLDGAAPTSLQAAVLAAANRSAEARRVLQSLPSGAPKTPDLALLRANCGLLDPLDALNTCFRRVGLADVITSRGLDGPLSLRTRRAAAPVEGPLVTVIVPAYNTENYITAAIGSLLVQSWRHLEILAVDDASTDTTAEKLRQLAAQDGRIKVLSHSRNAGPYVARMTALAQARGEFVTCHDSDDWAHPQRIEMQAVPLTQRRRLMATVSDWVRMTADGKFYVRKSWPLIHHNPASVMFRRREVLDRMGGFDLVRAGADSEFYERLKIVFGATAVRRAKGILAVGSHRSGSLMNDPAIGVTNHVLSPSRLAYWEAWRQWHVESVRAGRSPCMPPGEGRPFPAPAEVLVRAASPESLHAG